MISMTHFCFRNRLPTTLMLPTMRLRRVFTSSQSQLLIELAKVQSWYALMELQSQQLFRSLKTLYSKISRPEIRFYKFRMTHGGY